MNGNNIIFYFRALFSIIIPLSKKKIFFFLILIFFFFFFSRDRTKEKSIQIKNSAISPYSDPAHPFSFAIVTWKRVWVLQAPSQDEMEKWMKLLDPSINSREEQEYKEKWEKIFFFFFFDFLKNK